MHCSSPTHRFADPSSTVRLCTDTCTSPLFGDPLSGRCLSACLPGYYAQNSTRICVQ